MYSWWALIGSPCSTCEIREISVCGALTPDEARGILRKAPGVKVVDDLRDHIYPMPVLGAGNDDTLVGRIRTDLTAPNGLALFVVSDNLRKGAATNAVQIAQVLVHEHADKLSARA